jgi:hypothetical protein
MQLIRANNHSNSSQDWSNMSRTLCVTCKSMVKTQKHVVEAAEIVGGQSRRALRYSPRPDAPTSEVNRAIFAVLVCAPEMTLVMQYDFGGCNLRCCDSLGKPGNFKMILVVVSSSCGCNIFKPPNEIWNPNICKKI